MTVTLDLADPAVFTLLRDMERLNLVQVKDAPPASAEPPRRNRADGFGCLKGQIWMADDFDAPLEDFKDYM
jgi:hypothetical protein